MAFVPRSFTQILTDMIAYVQSRTDITDFTVGSVTRTLLEAAALEDDEQYFQMVQLLDIFSYTTAQGEDLDRRLADFNIVRLQAQPAFGRVRFSNNNLVIDDVAADTLAGSTSLQVFDSTGFPATTFPYTIRIGEDTTRVQQATVTGLDTATNVFTLSTPLALDAFIGDRVALVTGSSPFTISPGTNVQAPATATQAARIYSTSETASIPAGNLFSNEVLATAVAAGEQGNVGSNRVTQFVSSPPFTGAGVTNPEAFTGGLERESDDEFRARAVEKLQSLAKGTVLALKSASVGVTDPTTGQRVLSSNVLEDFAADPDEVIVYIDDGTGLDPDIVALAQDSVAVAAGAGAGTITLADASSFPSSGFVLVERLTGATVGVDDFFEAEYQSVDTNTLTLVGTTTYAVSVGDIVRRINLVSTGAEEGQRRFRLQNPPVVRNSERIYTKPPLATSWTLLTPNTDYVLNKGTGEFSIVDLSGLGAGTEVAAHYNYYTNLIAETQKVLEGDLGDSTAYPGVKAAGIFCVVEAPVTKRITVRISITAETTFDESELAPLVEQQVATYINSLKIGDDVIRSKIIDFAHNVQGVRSVVVQLPSSDVTVLENELPRAFDSNGDSIITIL